LYLKTLCFVLNPPIVAAVQLTGRPIVGLTGATSGHHTASVPTRAAKAADLVAIIEHKLRDADNIKQYIRVLYTHVVYLLLMSAVALMN